MKELGMDYSVILPVVTLPKQVESINRLSVKENGKEGISSAGAIQPDCENIKEILKVVQAHGLFGIKIYPDYQGVYFDDERYVASCMKPQSVIFTVSHAGIDVGNPNDVHCTPQIVLNVLDRYPEEGNEIMEKHGFDKIPFATDSLWSNPKKFIDILDNFGFSEQESDIDVFISMRKD